jgi:hypothetical protein
LGQDNCRPGVDEEVNYRFLLPLFFAIAVSFLLLGRGITGYAVAITPGAQPDQSFSLYFGILLSAVALVSYVAYRKYLVQPRV